ncbi:MAG: hypothetical protein CVT79_10275 [Alphaproteobacteria bacterium HGW-Alphaproteobacteria-18]|nr:MAG: hypothetical protein CVT79_10275 [Alphaproteobacteria bacterium HGW-Alphaproteobacteria-18]
MLTSAPKLAAAFSILAITACAQTGFDAKTAPPPTPEDIAAAAEAPAGWRPFSADSPWNTKIPADAPLDPNSEILIEDFASHSAMAINMPVYSVATYYIDASKTPKKKVYPYFQGDFGRGFEPGTRIPAPAFAVPPLPEGSTQYLAMIDTAAGRAWEMKQGAQNPETGTWGTSFGAEVDLKGTGVATPWMMSPDVHLSASPRPSGTPLIAGLIRLDEIKAGRIDHALALAYPAPRTGSFVPPASMALEAPEGTSPNLYGLPMGARIQLDPNYDIENTHLSPAGKVIARALQEYGAIIVDQTGSTVLFAESAPAQLEAWQGVLAPDELSLLFTQEMMGRNFRVLALGEKMPGRPEAWR